MKCWFILGLHCKQKDYIVVQKAMVVAQLAERCFSHQTTRVQIQSFVNFTEHFLHLIVNDILY